MSVTAVEETRSDEAPVVKKPQEFSATFFSGVALALGEYLKTRGQDGTSVLQAAGLKDETLSERYSRFSIQQLATAFELSEQQTNDPLFGLHFGEWYIPPTQLAGHYAISNAPNLREALNTVKDYRNRVVGIPTQLSDQAAFTELSWIIESASFYARHTIDFMAMRTLKHIQMATGADWRPLKVDLESDKPENLSEHHRLLGSNVQFSQPATMIRVGSDALALPMPNADPDLYLVAQNSFRNPFPCKQNDKTPVDQLRQFIGDGLDKNDVTLAAASKHMDMTMQQLRRVLRKHDTCFQCVLDETRRAHAAHYLCETETCFSEVAFQLGFSDQSAFSRAVKRWFGVPPKDMRRSNAGCSLPPVVSHYPSSR
jgi:AraC-like DNA-binding protein